MTSPLLPFDDFPIHQTPEPLRRVGSLHPLWTERWYFNLQHPSGDLLGVVGGGLYPATGVLETYACVLLDGRQYNVRAQTLTSDRLDMGAGTGVSFTVDQPLERWSISLDGNLVMGRLSFVAGMPPFLFEQFNVAANRWGEGPTDEVDRVQHFVQPGRIAGALDVEGHHVDVNGYLSFRDRTWGIRSRRPKLHNWYVVHLDGGGYLTLIHQERADGTRMASEMALVAEDGTWSQAVLDSHELTFDPVSRLLVRGVVAGHTSAGENVALEVMNLGRGVRLIGAGYTVEQGKELPVQDSAGEVFDLEDDETIRRTGRGTIDTPIRAELRWAGSSMSGIGVSETAVGRSHYRYGAGIA